MELVAALGFSLLGNAGTAISTSARPASDNCVHQLQNSSFLPEGVTETSGIALNKVMINYAGGCWHSKFNIQFKTVFERCS